MKIIVVSDLHGNLPIIKEPFDLMLLGGDLCPLYKQNKFFQNFWIKDELVKWINNLPYKNENSKVILIWGNHDFFGENCIETEIKEIEKLTNYKLKILNHEYYEHEYEVNDGFDSLKIFGTSYCSLFGNWAFMVNDETLEKKFSEIGEDVDILLSHDSPNINNLGAITEGNMKNFTTGNKILAKHIKRIKPIMFFSGHFHSGNHNFQKVDETYMANVSLVNEKYEPINPILGIDYNEETRSITKIEYSYDFSFEDYYN